MDTYRLFLEALKWTIFVNIFLYILIYIVWLRFVNHLLNYYLLTYLLTFCPVTFPGAYFVFFLCESAIIALIAFTKCSPFSGINWLVPIISQFKMMDGGQFYFIAYTHELWFFYLLVCFYTPFELRPLTSNPQSRRLGSFLLSGGYNYDVRLQFDYNSTTLFPFDDLRYGRIGLPVVRAAAGCLNK